MKTNVIIAYTPTIPLNEPFGVVIQEVPLVIIRNQEGYTVFEGKCLHQGAFLADGYIEDGHLVCPAHKWQYHLTTGAKKGKATICLQQFDSIIADNHLCVYQEDLIAWKQKRITSSTASSKKTKEHPSKTIADLPQPKGGLPWLGNVLTMGGPKMHQQLEQWSNELGLIYKIKLVGKYLLAIADNETINVILKNRPDEFRRYYKVEEVIDEMGLNGVFSAEGEAWRRQRKFATKGLSNRNLRQFFTTIQEVTERLQRRWQQVAISGEKVDVQKDLMRFTVDVTTTLAFGYEMNTLEKGDDVIQQHLEKMFPQLHWRVFMPIPYWRYISLPSDKQFKQSIQAVENTIQELIEQTRQKIADQPELVDKPTNFLEALLVARDEDGSTFSDREIIANAFTMLLAGEDTTAHTICWMIHYLLAYPNIYQRLQEEVKQVLGEKDGIQTYEQAQSFPYMDAIIQETMRLKPVAPLIAATALRDTTINGLFLPKDTNCFLLLRQAALKDPHFDAPYDFRPERWLKVDGVCKHAKNTSVKPFGYGPRLCPGRGLALLEIKMVMAMVCQNFQLIKPADAKIVTEHMAFTMGTKDLWVQFEERAVSC